MANVLYDKTSRYPPAGSLREALFLHVWLKRQGVEIERTRLLVQGLANKDNLEFLIPAFESFIGKMLPYMKDLKKKTDQEMVAALKKEAQKGSIQFQAIEDPHQKNLLKNRATALSAPDEYREKLAAGLAKRRGFKR